MTDAVEDPWALALDGLGLGASVYLRADLRPPWAMRIPARKTASYHVLLRGACVLSTASARWTMAPGELVLVPHGVEHVLADSADRTSAARRPPSVDSFDWRPIAPYAAVLHDPDRTPAPTILICGKIQPQPADHPLWASLPEVVHVAARRGQHELVATPIRWMMREIEQPSIGGASVIRRLSDLVVVGALRSWLAGSERSAGWIAGVGHPRLGRVLVEIDREPARAWSVEEMARHAGMSRARFAATFERIVGETPARYVLGCRIRRASGLLDAGSTVSEAAWAVGYRSEASFSRAFKRVRGHAPGRRR